MALCRVDQRDRIESYVFRYAGKTKVWLSGFPFKTGISRIVIKVEMIGDADKTRNPGSTGTGISRLTANYQDRTCLRRITPARPNRPEPNNQAAPGTGTVDRVTSGKAIPDGMVVQVVASSRSSHTPVTVANPVK